MKLIQLHEGTRGAFEKDVSSLKRSKRTGYVLKNKYDQVQISNITGITTLEGLVPPDHLDMSLNLEHLDLSSLKSCPRKIKGSLHAANLEITDLVGAPTFVGEYFLISDNKKLKETLVGGPTIVGVDVVCGRTPVNNWHNIHKVFTSVGNRLNFSNNSIKSHVLGTMLIEGGLKYIQGPPQPVCDILERFLRNGQEPGNEKMLDCQEALLDAGYEEFAKL